jgi:pimeloyl-ACP methyl ester carboxylesterase
MIPPDTPRESIAADREAVRQRLVPDKITLPGHSYGGMLAQELHE